MLTSHGMNPTFVELLAKDLNSYYTVHITSSKKNIFLRIIDMCVQFFSKIGSIKLVIIDTFSTKAYYYSLLISLLCKLSNKPYILVLSGGNLVDRLNRSKTFKFILQHSRYNISPSKYLKTQFNNFSIIYIPNYLNIEKYPFKYRRKISPKLLWVRSFHDIYNPEMAVRVLNSLCKLYPNSSLCMVGPDKDMSRRGVESLIASLDLQGQVDLPGRLSKKEWVDLSLDYDVFINTSNIDNHPVTILEAMALGIPIVSTNVGGIPYLIQDGVNGELVDANAMDFMVKKIDNYLKNENYALNISLNARKDIEEQFNKKNNIKKWCDIIDKSLLDDK